MNDQEMLVSAIFKTGSDVDQASTFESGGLSIYQRNLTANAIGALTITFPTVLTLIGEEVFSYAVERLIKQDPPSAGDWGEWGGGFPEVLKNLSALQAFPYVVDIARLDFLLHRIGRDKDSELDMDSISLLASTDLDELRVVLNPSISLLPSEFPVVDIYNANQTSLAESDFHLKEAQQKLVSGLGQVTLIYRPQFKPLIRTINPEEHHWLLLIQKSFSIGKALDALKHRKQTFSLEDWLPLAIQHNLISHLERI